MPVQFGTDTPDDLQGGRGDDLILGHHGPGADASPRTDNDTIRGLGGDDTLYGGHGDDALYGGAGRDVLDSGQPASPTDAPSPETLDGGAGRDQISHFAATSIAELIGGAGHDNLFLSAQGLARGLRLDLSDPASVVTLSNGTRISGFESLNFIGSAQGDRVTGGILNDQLVGGDGNDWLSGGAGHDDLQGDAGEDTLLGGAGNDWMSGSGGANTVYAGEGDDRVEVWLGEGLQKLHGEGGRDHLTLQNLWQFEGDIVLDLSQPDTRQTIAGLMTLDGFEGLHAVMGEGNDSITGGALGNMLFGEGGDDSLTGGRVRDSLEGGAGNDTLKGLGGSDFFGVNYSDTGTQADVLDGGAGVDLLIFESGAFTTLSLADPRTWQTASNGFTFRKIERLEFHGSDAGSDVTGGRFRDMIYGGAGDDTLSGGDGDDILSGGGGNDSLFGGAGKDSLAFEFDQTFSSPQRRYADGGAGDDVFYEVMGGEVTLHGGEGADSFLAVLSSPLPGTLHIDDFSAEDRLTLVNAVAFPFWGALGADHFVQGTAATGNSYAVIHDPVTGHVSFDIDGAGGQAAHLFLTVTPGAVLTADMFILQ